MIKTFDFEILAFPALCIFITTLIVSFYATRSAIVVLLASIIKTGLFLVYYGIFFDGKYTFLDDWTYLEGGEKICAANIGLTNLLDNLYFVLIIGNGSHFVYYLYNCYSFRLWGTGYYAPVALNIMLTPAIALAGALLAKREFGFSGPTWRWFYIFLLLHPDILAWSTIMNGKDIMVLFLHVIFLMSISSYFRGKVWVFFSTAVPVILVLLFLRFYVSILILLALLISLALWGRLKRRLFLILLGGGVFALVSVWLGLGTYTYAYTRISNEFVNPIYGFIRFALTPIPFNTETAYEFLNIPAALHWMMMPFLLVGVVRIYRHHTIFSKFFMLYVFLFVCLYAVYGELQGPRHRVQLDYALAVFQFVGLVSFLHSVVGTRTEKYERLLHRPRRG